MAITTRSKSVRKATKSQQSRTQKRRTNKSTSTKTTIPKTLTALEESNRLYEAALCSTKEEIRQPIYPTYLGPSERQLYTHNLAHFGSEAIDLSIASDAIILLALRDPELHDRATVQAVSRGLVDAYEAWAMHFAGGGIPETWLRRQEEELRAAAARLVDDMAARNVVFALRARYRAEVQG